MNLETYTVVYICYLYKPLYEITFQWTFEIFAIIHQLANMNVNDSTVIKNTKKGCYLPGIWKKIISLVTLRSV